MHRELFWLTDEDEVIMRNETSEIKKKEILSMAIGELIPSRSECNKKNWFDTC
jgi:hypothetical protein